MGHRMDDFKGRVRAAVGALTGKKAREREARNDRVVSNARQGAEDTMNRTEKATEDAAKTLHSL